MTQPEPHPFRSAAARALFLDHYDRRAAAWPVSADTLHVSTDLGTTFVRSCGEGAPLVLLPGIGSSSLMWLANVAGLASSFRVHAVDNVYDSGRSVWTRAPTTSDDFVQWLEQLYDGLGLHAPHLLGASYGAWIAACFGVARPDRVAGLVLFAPAGTVVPIRFAFVVRALSTLVPVRGFTRAFMRWLAHDTIAGRADGEALVEAAIEDGVLTTRCFRSRRLVPPHVLSDEELAALPDRTQLLVGSRERVFDPVAAVARVEAVAPQVEVHVVNGAGHDLPMARPDVFNAEVTRFLMATSPES